MPGSGLDESWVYSLNQAVAQRLVFGRDIIFTFGPYASIDTYHYHPATVWIMLIGGSLLVVCYSFCFAWLVRRAKWPWPLFLAALLVIPLARPDALFFFFSLLEALLIFRLQDEELDEPRKPAALLWAAALIGCAGMLPLIKASFAVMELGFLVLCLSFLVLRRQWTLALICGVSPLTGMLLFWAGAGQRILDLPDFFSGYLQIVSGYSDALSAEGPRWELLTFLLGAMGLLLLIIFARRLKRQQKTFLLLIYGFYLFMCFKDGFVRHDDAHIAYAQAALALGCLSLTLLQTPQVRRFNVTLCLVAFLIALAPLGFMWRRHFDDSQRVGGEVPNPGLGPNSRPLMIEISSDLGTRILRKLGLTSQQYAEGPGPSNAKPWTWREQFDDTRRQIFASSQLDFDLAGTVDVYSDDQSELLSGGLNWDPRPVFQSYSAYTPALILRNERHLRSSAAPDHIVFRLEPIDDHLPSLEDGLSWPAMLDNYRVANISRSWVHLVRNPGTLRKQSRFTPLRTESAQLGQEVALPSGGGPVFVQIEIHPSLYGQLLALLYKLPPLKLTLTCGNNRRATYRVIRGMMETGFFVSPLITDNDGFARLFNPSEPGLEDETVRSVRLDAAATGWSGAYKIAFRRYEY